MASSKRKWQSVLDEMRAEALSTKRARNAQAWKLCNSWSLILVRHDDGVRVRWHLSALPYPPEHTPSNKDHRWLKTMAAYLGADGEPAVEPPTRDGRQPIHWQWEDPGALQA